jgi:pimeloyl-ACP methyl ester carboxylesterase
MSTEVPFTYRPSDAEIDDLRDRLHRTRWPERETVDDWSQGVPLQWLRSTCDYWADGYDFQAGAARLNRFPQFRREVDGLGLHYIHVRSPEPGAWPIVLTHGWPGSVVEFLDVIAPLTDPRANGGDPADAFHVVCPSLPGYGFSDKPTRTGWGLEAIASAWVTLMHELGYDRFAAQGGDWGAGVTAAIGAAHPDAVSAIHMNIVPSAPTPEQLAAPAVDEVASLQTMATHQRWGTGYSQEQMTRPQTIGYSLVDSPVGQAAWILEKFWAWTDCNGDPERALTRDQMLDNVSLYWFTATGAASARLYWESLERFASAGGAVDVPAGFTTFPKEIVNMSRRWAENRFSTITYWNEVDRGGHFAAFEQPDLFVDELRRWYRPFR